MTTTAPPAPGFLVDVAGAVEQSDFFRANTLAKKALADGHIHPALFNVQAMWHERNGRDAEAAALYERAAGLAPDDPAILNVWGLCLARLGRFDRAVAALEKAVNIRPDYALSHYRLGHTLWRAERYADAEVSLKRALSLQPQMAEALSCLAAVAAATGDMPSAGSYARRTLQYAPGDPTAICVAAAVELADGRFSLAEARLRPLAAAQDLPDQQRATALALLGRALRLQGNAKESYDAYQRRNALLASEDSATPSSLSTSVLRLDASLARAAPSFWHSFEYPHDAEQQSAVLAFLFAFPRSGAEVLAAFLERHPGITVLRGSDPLAEAERSYLLGAPEKLGALSGSALTKEREAYWAKVRASAPRARGMVLLDASDRNLVRLPLIAKLFPEARLIGMRRDPRDIITSCIMEMPRVANLLPGVPNLEAIARIFDQTSAHVRAVLDRIPLPVTTVHYERLIADPRGALNAVCEFVDLDWSNAASGGGDKLKDDFGYSSEQPGMWRVWSEQLSSVLPALQPSIEEWAL